MNTLNDVYAETMVNGGATFTPDGVEAPTFGYLVSVGDTEYVTDVHDFGPDVIDAYVTITDLPEGAYYGTWVEDGKVYLDVSLWVATEAEAMLIADLEDQLAVFNCYDQKVEYAAHTTPVTA